VNKRPLVWFALAAAIVAAAAFVHFRGRGAAQVPSAKVLSPLDVVPPGAALVLSFDLPHLAATPAGKELIERGVGLLGLGSDDCAARTVRQATALVLAVDGAAEQIALPEPSELAIIATGPFDGEAVARCVEEAITKKKGQPVRTTLGSFVSVRDQRGGSGEVAIRSGGPLAISNGHYLRSIVDAADGKPPQPSELEKTRDALHGELRRTFGRGAPLIATVTLPSGWLERTLGDADAKLSPFSELRSAALRLEPAGDGCVLEALFGHASPQAAERVEKLSAELLPELRPLLERELGARVAAQLVPRREQAALRLSVHLTQGEIEKLLTAATR
jgi:hypothetical protein